VIGSIVLYTILNACIFSLIFWILTFSLKYFYSNKNFEYKLNFYECGFKSLTNIKIQYNINFVLIILFLIIYDGEFLFLIPFALNVSIASFASLFLIFFFIFFLTVTILYDLIYNSLEWQVKIRWLFRNININPINLLKKQLISINYSNNLILKKKHIMYNIIKKIKNK